MVSFSGDDDKIIFRMGNLPEDTAYDYSKRVVRSYLFREIEIMFYSEEYRYAGQVSLIWSTGMRTDSIGNFLTTYYYGIYGRNGVSISGWDRV